NLKNGNTKSCGCRRNEPAFEDRTGRRYGRLVVKALAKRERGKVWWVCECDCGGSAVVSVAHMIASHTRSCGCLLSEVSSRNARAHLGGEGPNHPRWRDDLSDADRAKCRGDAVR